MAPPAPLIFHGTAVAGISRWLLRSRADLIAKLNEDLAREYQAIIAYVVYSQVLKGAET